MNGETVILAYIAALVIVWLVIIAKLAIQEWRGR